MRCWRPPCYRNTLPTWCQPLPLLSLWLEGCPVSYFHRPLPCGKEASTWEGSAPSLLQDLNPPPADYKTAALPDELRRHDPWISTHLAAFPSFAYGRVFPYEDVLLNVCWFILWTLQLVHRAKDGARTRNILLGRQELYQLSYFCVLSRWVVYYHQGVVQIPLEYRHNPTRDLFR